MKAASLFVLLLAVPVPAAGTHGRGICGSDSNVALGTVEVGNGDPAATFYVEFRDAFVGPETWIYQESNGIYDRREWPHYNLQRGPSAPWNFEMCVEPEPTTPDTLLGWGTMVLDLVERGV